MRNQVWTCAVLACAGGWIGCSDDNKGGGETQLGEPVSESRISPIDGEPGLGTSTDFALADERLCASCTSSAECGGGGNLCLVRSDGVRFCGRDCRTSACPSGYTCLRLTSTIAQCVPPQGDCSRVSDAGVAGDAGRTNDAGVDAGVRADAGAPVDAGARSDAGAIADAGASTDVPGTPSCAPAAAWDPSWVGFEQEVLRLSNLRRQAGATCGTTSYAAALPLTMEPALRCAARLHSKDMQDRAYFSHTTPDGVTFSQRITQAGYDWRTIGENIASGYRTPQAVVDGWMNSPGHCQNIMNSSFTQIGVGFYGNFLWTQDFGAPF